MTSTVNAVVKLNEGMAFEATSTSGHKVMLDAGTNAGGQNLGFRPVELLAMGLGGCTGMDVISILRKKQQQVSDYEIRVTGERTGEHPKVYTHMDVEHVVRGKGVEEAAVRRAIELSANKYCPTAAMLSKAVPITYCYRIIDEETGQETTGSL